MAELIKTFETARLTIRPVRIDDAAELHRSLYSDPEVTRFFSGRTYSLEQVKHLLGTQVWWNRHGGDQGFGRWTAIRREDGRIVGRVNCARPARAEDWVVDPGSPYAVLGADFGIACAREFWGMGFAVEALGAVIDYVFRELRVPRLLSYVNARNVRSKAIHRRLGVRFPDGFQEAESGSYLGILENPLVRSP